MNKFAITSFLFAFAAFAVIVQAQPVQTWARYLDINVNTTAAGGGANTAGAATDFPLLVRLDSANATAVFAEALAGGADVRFASEAGAEIPYYIESWSATKANIWVRVPAIAGNANTKVRLYWKKPGVSTTSSSTAVFDSTQFTGVWKMNEGNGDSTVVLGAGTTADATASGLNFTRHSNTRSAPGVIGNSRYYNYGQANASDAGSLTTYIVDSIANNVAFQARANEPITISAWTNRISGSNGASGIFGHFRYTSGNNRSYCLLRTGTAFRTIVSTGGSGDDIPLNSAANYGAGTDRTWFHVTLAISPATGIKMWVNGTQEINDANPAQPLVGVTAAAGRPLIGALERNFGQRFIGLIDELRLSNGILRDGDWAKLDYETQKPGATAVTLGAAANNDTSRIFFYPLKNATYTQTVPITNNVPYVKAGNSVTAYAIAPTTLPAGLSFNTGTGVISGTPSAAATQTQFIVTATIASNPYRDTLTITVVGGSVPGVPGTVAATAGSAQATVTWSAPSNAGTTPVTSYLVRAVQDTTKGCTWTTGPLSCTVTGLTNGTGYTFTVRAVNSFGAGPAATSASPTTPAGVPGSPTAVLATVTSATTVLVSWTAPASNGGSAITDYYVTGAPGGQLCYSPPIASPSCSVTSLTTGTSYTFTVVAANAMGNSPPSAPSNAVTPVGLLSGYAIQVTGSSKPFTFALTPKAVESTDALTMTISDVYGRTVWSKTVNPKRDGATRIVWSGRATTGSAVSAGVYIVRVSALNGGTTSTFIQKAVEQK